MSDFKIMPVRKSCGNCCFACLEGCTHSNEFFENQGKVDERNMVCGGWKLCRIGNRLRDQHLLSLVAPESEEGMNNFRILPVRKSCDNCCHEAVDGCSSSKEYWDKFVELGVDHMVCDGWKPYPSREEDKICDDMLEKIYGSQREMFTRPESEE